MPRSWASPPSRAVRSCSALWDDLLMTSPLRARVKYPSILQIFSICSDVGGGSKGHNLHISRLGFSVHKKSLFTTYKCMVPLCKRCAILYCMVADKLWARYSKEVLTLSGNWVPFAHYCSLLILPLRIKFTPWFGLNSWTVWRRYLSEYFKGQIPLDLFGGLSVCLSATRIGSGIKGFFVHNVPLWRTRSCPQLLWIKFLTGLDSFYNLIMWSWPRVAAQYIAQKLFSFSNLYCLPS